ncbi:heavy metal translocating P-type ATPase metal-binding domain-containing protein [Thalassospira sp.]|uniref:heavy metal translocating P-type ATPase metal-binding domain-containing protein n=1 Tax=Thalassospira sp. TaxID=1912094 RepID=UPI003AA9E16C
MNAITACRHCGEPVTASSPAGPDFCCTGCEGAFSLINDLGLQSYYTRRSVDPNIRALKPEDDGPGAFDFTDLVSTGENGECHLDMMIDGLHCAACVWLIETILQRQQQVVQARINMTTRRLHLAWQGQPADIAGLIAPVFQMGYRLIPFDPETLERATDQRNRELLRCLAVAGFAAGNVMLLSVSIWAGYIQGMGEFTRDLFHWFSALIAVPAVAYAGRPFFRSALGALRHGRVNMDVPITLAVLLALGMSLFETMRGAEHAYFDSAITLLFFLLIGRYLDGRARSQARSAAEHMLTLRARSITIINPDGTRRVLAPEKAQPGMVVLVAAGERVGIDGDIIEGQSDIDTSVISGESLPSPVNVGSRVFAGTMNLSAPVRVQITATGDSTLLAEIVRLMENAEQGRAKYVALADRVARAYAPVVHSLAAITFLGWWLIGGIGWQDSLMNAIAVLIVTCPCALALAVPVVQVLATGRLLKAGILVKSATALERLTKIDGVLFDKTGTLTTGHPELITTPDHDTLKLAASMAANSNHPLSRALVRAAGDTFVAARVSEHPGQGLSMMVPQGEVRLGSREFCGANHAILPTNNESGPEIWLAEPGKAATRFGFRDLPRPDAASTIATLHAEKIPVLLLSGDRADNVRQLANELDIASWQAALSPAQKVSVVEQRALAGHHDLMVGDGINDAPALAAAHASMSPASAAEISQNAADIIFQGDRLGAVITALGVARMADRLVRQNFSLSFAYNIVTIPLAVAGIVTPLIAAIAMSTSSLVVIANALRLNWKKQP